VGITFVSFSLWAEVLQGPTGPPSLMDPCVNGHVGRDVKAPCSLYRIGGRLLPSLEYHPDLLGRGARLIGDLAPQLISVIQLQQSEGVGVVRHAMLTRLVFPTSGNQGDLGNNEVDVAMVIRVHGLGEL